MRCIALSFLFALVLAGCGNEPPGFYDDDAKALAKRAVQQRKFADPNEVVASVKERHDCPQAPS
jgi:hypothetical protein